ncbi:uncharacterized protein CTRU02_209412 [Colletotrichum truncatum]|uniref:Uncharacterized protein n=1 Tax=Colletotrichum truncatum TaxID=5467 RepID=A0ACC3YTN2_COLTU|nr:uncharacterized protein CTRU02_08512 [Colletotrichum truncatum]KAF6789813.1 hypothetical protein CTRU02_08512 [Colletotrichum truncatum]
MPYEPGVDEGQLIATIGPRSFLFFIVADVGAPGSKGGHRPLAITYRQGRGHGPGRTMENGWQRVRQVIQDCARAVDILTMPGNRAAIEAELSMAVAEYRDGDNSEPQRVQVPDLPQPSLDNHAPWGGHPKVFEQPEQLESPPWVDSSAIREFPFISLCLRLALNNEEDDSRARFDHVQERPLATIFPGNVLEYGAVVIDISDLDAVRYGIFGSRIRYVGAKGCSFGGTWGWDSVESDYSGPPPVLHLETARARTPLSAGAYMTKFGLHETSDDLERLRKYGIVERRALNYIWPPLRKSGGSSTPALPIDEHDAAVEVVSSLLDSGTFDLEAHRESIILPELQSSLRKHLIKNFDKLKPSGASAQLLRLAYAGCCHLNWAAYRHLSYEHTAAILVSEEFRNAQALSICIDGMDGRPTSLFEALAQHETIRDICFLQGPSRANDDKSSDLFSQICMSPFASILLKSKKTFVTCDFSAPLRRADWPRDPSTRTPLDSPALRSALPVQPMFVRQQSIPEQAVDDQDDMDL